MFSLRIWFVRTLGPGKTRTHHDGNIVSCDVARLWQNAATLLHAARIDPRNVSEDFNSCVQNDTKFVSNTNVARMAKRVDICETWSLRQCFGHNDSSFGRPLIEFELHMHSKAVWSPHSKLADSSALAWAWHLLEVYSSLQYTATGSLQGRDGHSAHITTITHSVHCFALS